MPAGYKPPEEFEQTAEEIYQSDITSNEKGESAETGSPDYRLDDFPVGLFLGGLPRIPFTG